MGAGRRERLLWGGKGPVDEQMEPGPLLLTTQVCVDHPMLICMTIPSRSGLDNQLTLKLLKSVFLFFSWTSLLLLSLYPLQPLLGACSSWEGHAAGFRSGTGIM